MQLAVGKGSLLRAASAAGKAQKAEEHAAVPEQMAAEGSRKKVKRAAQRATAEETEAKKLSIYVTSVPSGLLREIPGEWRGPRYVCPNVSMLAESVSRCGILEPLPVVQTGEKVYQLVGGSKRMQVVRMLGIEEVPVAVLPGSSMEDAEKIYRELAPFSDAAQDTVHQAKFRTAALFGSQRIPEYLL